MTTSRIWRVVVAGILVAALVFPPVPVANACGPFLAEAVFTDMKTPDFDYGEYLHGRLGIVQPSYYDQFLYVAYRNLTGAPFTKDETAVLNPSLQTNPTSATSANERQPSQRDQQTEETLWHLAIGETDWPGKHYSDSQGVIFSGNSGNAYISFYNCLPDAFKSARERLEQHRKQFGADSPAVHSWLEAQQQVFDNCGKPFQYNQPRPAAVIPVSAPGSDPPVIRMDRKYQIAAAYFYAGDYDTAAARFSDIAKNEESDWRGIAMYLQARALIRKGTVGDENGKSDRDALLSAEKLLKQILADPQQTSMHAAAQRRLDFVSARLRPDERRAQLASKLLHSGSDPNFDQDKTDYFWLLDNTPRSIGASDDLTNWIFTMKTKSTDGTNEAVRRWKETKSLPWLVASLCKADANAPEASELLQAAQQVPASSPAHTTLLFHSLRLRARRSGGDTVIAELDRVLGGEFSEMPQSAQNQFLALRMSLARSYAEFLRFAPRVPAGAGFDSGMDDEDPSMSSFVSRFVSGKVPGPRFDADAAIVLSEKIPLKLLVEAANDEKLPPGLQRMVTLGTWTRAVLLKNDDVAQNLAPRVVAVAPELKPAFESYLAAKSPEERTFAAVYAILRSPGLRPFIDAGTGRNTPTAELDNLRDNWWCSFAPSSNGQPILGSYSRTPWSRIGSPLKQIYPDGKIPAPAFLSQQESQTASNEFDQLTKLPPAPDWLGSETLAFAKSYPDDPRVPEALHNVVRTSRFGCSGQGTGSVSKAAFDLLHKRYPDSEWAKKTPYWFK